jgi:hypothetical protein
MSPHVGRPCDPERGWLDPLDEQGNRVPTMISDENGTQRVCEIRQLGEPCPSSPACEGCGSGWCRIAPEVKPAFGEMGYDHCLPGRYPSKLRLVGGALAGSCARFSIICNLAQ